MRKKEKEITDNKELLKILQEGEICYLALANNNIPYIVPVNYGYENNAIYFHCAHEGRKIDMLKQNPEVCFHIGTDVVIKRSEKACSWTTQYKSIIAYGTAQFITLKEEKIKGLDIIMSHYAPNKKFTYKEANVDRTTIIKVAVREIKGKKSD